MNVDSVSITLDERDSVRLGNWRQDAAAFLVLGTGRTCYEITLHREHVTALRDQLPDALAGLDRWAAEEDGCVRAAVAEHRADQTAARALDLAASADEAGAHEVAAALRTAANEATGRAEATDAAVRAFENATDETDRATEKLNHAIRAAEKALHQNNDDR